MAVPELLLDTLDGMNNADFGKFKWYLSIDVLDGCKPIPVSRLEDAPRTETVSKVIQTYGEELAVSVTHEVLRKMNMNNAAQKLKNAYAGGKTAVPSTSSSAAAPLHSAPAPLSAQQGGVVIAPTISGSTTGSVNITIHKA
ncbi:caspase b-like [Trachinotus anak]|uniref:caspase b-like n=1 Tax=Trachinotus anak TaxID=443729 RepID=UPI0039F16AB5